MDNKSDDVSRPAEKWDPLTSPNWETPPDVEPKFAPPVSEFVAEKPEASRHIPQPPDVDEILRGEYTGWVPLIKPGDTVESATIRFEVDNQARILNQENSDSYDQMFEEVADDSESEMATPESLVNQEDLSEIQELIREMKSEPEVYVKDFYPNFKDLVEDPDTVTSPAQALEEARRRIEQMRANLQVNLSRVAQSFEHPIFEPTTESQRVEVETVQEAEIIETQPEPVQSQFEQVHTEQVHTEQIDAEQTFAQPQQPIAQTTTVVSEEPAKQDHSLELVIMRDEIKDLRDRLDASQKLIETLMERLANLAELALTNRKD